MITESQLKVFEVPLDEIYSDEDFNCRGKIAPIDVVDLARSIEMHGLQQVITIQPFSMPDNPHIKWRIVSGHRRYTAFHILGRVTIPCLLKENLTELDAMKLNFEENLKRMNLNILQEARTLKKLKDAGLGQEETAAQLNVSRGWVQIRYMLLDLPVEIQQEAGAGFINQQQIREIYKLPLEQQFEMAKKIKIAKLNGESVERFKTVKKPAKAYEKRERLRDEMFELQTIIRDTIGNSFATRVLAWTAGEISDYEIHRDLKEMAMEEGKNYDIPAEMVKSMNFRT